MEIRAFRETDRDAIQRITIDCFGEGSIFSLAERKYGQFRDAKWQELKVKHVEDDLDLCRDGVFVVAEAEEIIGFITAIPDESTGIGWIHNLAVAPGNQGKGVGKALIQHALDYFSQLGMTHAKIETLVGNDAGGHLYPKMGFDELCRQVFYMVELPEKS